MQIYYTYVSLFCASLLAYSLWPTLDVTSLGSKQLLTGFLAPRHRLEIGVSLVARCSKTLSDQAPIRSVCVMVEGCLSAPFSMEMASLVCWHLAIWQQLRATRGSSQGPQKRVGLCDELWFCLEKFHLKAMYKSCWLCWFPRNFSFSLTVCALLRTSLQFWRML